MKSVWIFVNPTSGSNLGSQYIDLLKNQRREKLAPNSVVVSEYLLHIYDIREGDPGQKPGLQRLQETGTPGQLVMIAGGDGTVTWVLEEFYRTPGLQVEDFKFGIIPFGTGNDLSRVLNWGSGRMGNLIGRDDSVLLSDLEAWTAASYVDIDLWDARITSHPGGSFEFSSREPPSPEKILEMERTHGVQDGPQETKIMRKIMVNYYGLGFCARVGLGVERHRTKSKFKNVSNYLIEGTKKTFLHKLPNLPDFVHSICVLDTRKDGDQVFEDCKQLKFRSAGSIPLVEDDDLTAGHPRFSGRYMVGSPIDLCVLSIPSISGGANIWKCATRLGIEGSSGSRATGSDKAIFRHLMKSSQQLGDQQLSTVIHQSSPGMSADVATKILKQTPLSVEEYVGRGLRIWNGPQTFVVNFLPPTLARYRKKGRCYMQLDGECFRALFPKQAMISHKSVIHMIKRS